MNNKRIGILFLSATCLLSCGGTSSNTNNTPPYGPISYNYVYEAYSPTKNKQLIQTQSKSLSSFNQCGVALNDAEQAISLINLVASSTALGDLATILGFIPSSSSISCLTNTVINLSNQLNLQQQQISQIESTLQLQNNMIWQNMYAVQTSVANTDQYNYSQAALTINGNTDTGINGIFTNFMIDLGFWNSNGNVNPNITESQIASNQNYMNSGKSFIQSQQTTAQLALQNTSGTQYSLANCKNSGNCYQLVQAYASSSYNILLDALNAEFQTQLAISLESGINIVPLYDNYNNMLSSFYQQNLVVISEAYQMEFTINQLNALSKGKTTQLPSLFEVPYASFEYNTKLSESENTTQYNNAQLQLGLYFSALVNQTYSLTLQYTISDTPVGLQSYPNTLLNYINANGIESTESGFTNYNVLAQNTSTPISQFNGDSLVSNAMLYQYSGINNINQCMSSLESYNQLNGPSNNLANILNNYNCSPIFWNSAANSAYNQSIYIINNSLQPYYYNSTSFPVLNSYNGYENLNLNNSVGNLNWWQSAYNGNWYLVNNAISNSSSSTFNGILPNGANTNMNMFNLGLPTNIGGCYATTTINFSNINNASVCYPSGDGFSTIWVDSSPECGTGGGSNGYYNMLYASFNPSSSINFGRACSQYNDTWTANATSYEAVAITPLSSNNNIFVPIGMNIYVVEDGKTKNWYNNIQIGYPNSWNIESYGVSCNNSGNTQVTCNTFDGMTSTIILNRTDNGVGNLSVSNN